MKTELILKSDVLDIVFENRNKAYGAYYLRKFYNSRLLKSLGFMLLLVIVLSAFTFIPKKKNTNSDNKFETVAAQILQEPEKKEKEQPKEKPRLKQKTVALTNKPDIVNNNVKVKPLEEITDSTAIADVTEEGDPGVQAVVGDKPYEGGEKGGTGTKPDPEPVIDAITPTHTAEVMPEYPGGMAALRKFLERNLTNPRDMEENEMISVKVRFVVGFDGKLKSFETIEDGGEEFNKEVIRVLKKMPEWIPGKTRGQNVSVYYTIPVKFIPANG